MHNRLLQKQIKKYLRSKPEIEPSITPFLQAISNSYEHYENDRILIERAMELSSKELNEVNTILREDNQKKGVVLDKLREAFHALKRSGSSFALKEDDNLLQIAELIHDEVQTRIKIETELKTNQANLLALVENINEATLSIDKNNQLITFNSAAKHLYFLLFKRHLKVGETILSEVIDMLSFINISDIENALSGNRFSTEREIILNKSRYYYEISFNPIQSANEIHGVTILAKNVTVQKRNETLQKVMYEISEMANITESIKMFYHEIHRLISYLIYSENIIIARYDKQTDIISFPYAVDEHSKAISARKIENNFIDSIIKTLEPRHYIKGETFGMALSSDVLSAIGVPLILNNEIVGTIIAYSYINDIYKDEDLELLGIVSTHIANTIERKESKQALQESEIRYRTVINNIKEIIFQTDVTGNWTFLNPAWEEIMGYSLNESLNQNFINYIYRPDVAFILERLSPLINKKIEFINEEIRFKSKTGKIIWFKVYAQVNLNQNEALRGIFGTLNNITETKEYEDELIRAKENAEAGAKSKSDFLATMSHEIRTPLNGILGMTQIMSEMSLTPEQKEYLKIIDSSGNTLFTIINDILDFSKIESGNMELDKHEFDLRTSIEDSVRLCKLAAHKKGLVINYYIEPNVCRHLLGDSVRIGQILINLINNAIKFTDEGYIFILVNELFREKEITRIQIAVKDTGIGIPEEKRDRLFKAFSQIDSSISRKFGGTGLGLAICAKLCALMNGKIFCEETSGIGSTFTFEIEVHLTSSRSKREQNLAIPQLEGKSLYFDIENECNQLVFSKYLDQWHMNVTTDPKQADLLIFDDYKQPDYEQYKSPKIPIINALNEFSLIDTHTLNPPFSPIQVLRAFIEKITEQSYEDIQQHSTHKLTNNFSQDYPRKILIVEDNEINQKTLTALLGKMGYLPDVASTGLEALDQVNKKVFDLIFMDLQMPGINGYETTKEIFKRAEKPPKIIALTANAQDDDIKRCFEVGMDDYLAKPVNLDELQNTIILWGN